MRVILSILLALTWACTSSGGSGPEGSFGSGGKADGPECEGAALDTAGMCRISGRFAPAECCGMEGPAAPAVNPLQLTAERVNRFWGDANISSSTIHLATGALDSSGAEAAFEANNEALVAELWPELHYDDWPGGDFTTELDDEVYEDAGFDVSEYVSDAGFHYSPENHEDRCRVRWQLEGVLDWLDEYRESMVKVTTRASVEEEGETQTVTLTAFYNQEDGRYVYVYLREGSF